MNAYHPETGGAQSDENNQTSQTSQSSALNKKGLEFLNSGSYNESLGYFDKALAVSPDNAKILDNKGFALYTLGNFSGIFTIMIKTWLLNLILQLVERQRVGSFKAW